MIGGYKMSEIKNMSIDKDKIFEELKTKYKEVKIDKMIVNGREQVGNIISGDDTKEKQELNVTLYTQNPEDTSETGKESS